jgi:hypothetical protein
LLKLTYFITKKVSGELLPQRRITHTLHRQFSKFNIETPPTKMLISNEVLLSSLYLQKVLKYLHLANLNDISLLPLSDLDSTCLYACSFPNANIENITYTLFFTNRTKYTLRSPILKQFFNKDKLYYKCFSNLRIHTNHTLEIQSSILQSLNFLKQKEFQLILKKNLDLSRENR